MHTLAEQIKKTTGTSPLKCYQCGRCSAGCAQNEEGAMDLGPTRIMHLIQMENAFKEQPGLAAYYRDRVLQSEAIWMCASCHTCTQRCPQGIDIASAMDTLRQASLAQNKTSSSKRVRDIISSHRAFLNVLKRTGKNDEVALVGEYKLRTGNLLDDMNVAPYMMLKGKINPLKAVGSALSLLKRGPSEQMKAVCEAAEALRKEEEL